MSTLTLIAVWVAISAAAVGTLAGFFYDGSRESSIANTVTGVGFGVAVIAGCAAFMGIAFMS